MSDDTVKAKLGKMLVPGDDWPDEYTPDAARAYAAAILAAADEADMQHAAILAACAQGHAWDAGSNWGDGEHARTVWRCKREGCEGRREQPGHHIDDSAHIQALRDALPADDEMGRMLLDFDSYPDLFVFGARMSREDRIDMAAHRVAWQRLMREAFNAFEPSAPSEAFGPQVTLTAEMIGVGGVIEWGGN